MITLPDGPPVLSLFSGAGGLDLGAQDAGADVKAGVEPDPDCVRTLLANHRMFPKLRVIPTPIERVSAASLMRVAGLQRGEAALLIGGPPCQPFSKSGYWLLDQRLGLEDPRAWLLHHYIRILKGTRPAGFIFENVASLMHPKHRNVIDTLIEGAESVGYATRTQLVHSVQYGVPQTRARLFVTGYLGKNPPKRLEPTHWWRDANQNKAKLLPPETAGRWIASLDKEHIEEAGETPGGRWLEHLREVPPGWNYKWHTEWAGHPRPTFVTETKFWSFLLKLSPYRPSWTIQASPGPWTGPLHWNNRRLRIPELAALQTFPRSFRFEGDRRTVGRQIGNAVPPLLASKIVASLLRDIMGQGIRRGRKLRYQLADHYPLDEDFVRLRGPRW
ncbi:MAG: DNA cytosine methyltransferase [Actinomycetota bacterium]